MTTNLNKESSSSGVSFVIHSREDYIIILHSNAGGVKFYELFQLKTLSSLIVELLFRSQTTFPTPNSLCSCTRCRRRRVCSETAMRQIVPPVSELRLAAPVASSDACVYHECRQPTVDCPSTRGTARFASCSCRKLFS